MAQPDAILHWYEDEIFFSLCSRQHQFLGHLNTSSTLEWLYGSPRSATTHDFPSNLSSLDCRMRDCWGDPTSIILEHTILPLLIPFQSKERIDKAVAAMSGSSIGSIKYSLGLLTGRFGAEHPLKACASCMDDDRIKYGVTYWHLGHQYPGVVLCPVHGLLLKTCSVNRPWSGRFKWVLPSQASFETSDPGSMSAPVKDALKKVGFAVLDLVAYGKQRSFDPLIVREVYKRALDELSSTPAAHANIAASFAEFTSHLQGQPPFSCLPTAQSDAAAFLAQMTCKPRSHKHPLKHLTLITWLFGQLSRFVEAYERLEILRNGGTQPVPEDELKTRVKKDGLTKRSTILKPKKLKLELRAAILLRLHEGDSKNQICSQFDISICTVNRLIRNEPAVKAFREENYQRELLSKHRIKWVDTVSTNPDRTPKQIRSMIPSIYAWLYRNDRNWLNDQILKLPCGRRSNNSAVDWDKRDVLLSNKVLTELAGCCGAIGQLKLTNSEVFRLVPGLSRLLEKRDRYPITRMLMANITRRS
ncbi:MAG: TnsD family Tn7-like transposition protein [Pseudomonas sp.]